MDALSDDELRTSLLVRVSFDRGGLTFGLAEFVEEDGTTTQRAVPFADGRPPSEIDLPVDGRMKTYQSSTRGDRVAFSPVGSGPSIGDTLRQEDPTGDFDVEFPPTIGHLASRSSDGRSSLGAASDFRCPTERSTPLTDGVRPGSIAETAEEEMR